jgi:N-acetylmuramoyl-L-alanine amidase
MIRSSAINHGFVLGYKDAKWGSRMPKRMSAPETVIRSPVRALAEQWANEIPVVANAEGTLEDPADSAAKQWLSGMLRVGAIVLAIALDLASVLEVRSQMPLPIPDPPPIELPPTEAPAPDPAAAEGPPVATDARLAGDDQQTRLVIDVSRKIDMRAFALADPYRVVIEIPQVNFQLPPNTGEHGRGIIKAFRWGLVMAGQSRIVVDLASPVRVKKAFVLDRADGQPARMVLDLVAVDRETFMRATAIDNHLPRAPPPSQAGESAHRDREEPATDPRPLVVLDPGHGGIDPGTRAPSGELEKDIVLEFAAALRAKLEATGKYRVTMTRTEDTFVELSERVRLARQRQAQLMISIHCDALARGEGEAEGATVYTLSDKASDGEAQRLADAENRADVIAGVDLAAEPDEIADILIDLAQRETRTFSTEFARNVVKELRAAARLHKRPQKSAGFRVLRAPDIPSVLIELGYVSNPRDLKHLVSDSWRSRTGDAVVQAVNSYFATRLAGGGAGTRAP